MFGWLTAAQKEEEDGEEGEGGVGGERGRLGHTLCLSSHSFIEWIFTCNTPSMGTHTRWISTAQIFLAVLVQKEQKLKPNFKRLLNDASVSGRRRNSLQPQERPTHRLLRNQIRRTDCHGYTVSSGPPSDPRPNETPQSWFTRCKSQTSKDEQHLRLNKNRRRTFVVKSLLLSPADGGVKVEEADRFGPRGSAWKWQRWRSGCMLKVERWALAYYDLSVNYWGCPKIEMLVNPLGVF